MSESEGFNKLTPQTSGSEEAKADVSATEQDFSISQIGGTKEKLIEKPKKFSKIRAYFDFSDPKRKKRAIITISVLGTICILFIFSVIIPTFGIIRNGKAFYQQTQNLANAGQSQDIGVIRAEITNTRTALEKLNKSYKGIVWLRFFPWLGVYVKDGQRGLIAAQYGLEGAETLITTIEPYADIIGLTGGQAQGESTGGEQTAEERVDFIVQSISSIIPKVDELAEKAKLIDAELSQINPSKYPVSIGGIKVRDKLAKGLRLADQGTNLMISGKPLIQQLPYLLGIERERTYLILFQNDKELRPTGGFMTAYTIANVKDGKFEPVVSSDIYNLDAKYTPSVSAPDPIIDYLKGPYILQKNFKLRDINWSPDFKESMDAFTGEAEKVGIDEIDGVIAVDTQLLVYLLDVIGPIGVPGFGNFSTELDPECNCPQVIYELESFADVEGPIVWDPVSGEIVYRPPHSDNRKEIIGPLMNSILANTLGQPKEKLPGLFEAAYKSLMEKHVLFYLLDDKTQAAVESFGIAGRLEGFDGDYLHINDANLGGRKSNLYVTQEVAQEIEIAKDGSVTKTVTITYKNPEKHDGWLNSVLPNWVRVYVPLGSELIDVSGLEEKKEPYEDLGKTVFAGYFELRPEGLSRVIITYKLPFKVDNGLPLLIQKQPGTDKPLYSITSGRFEDEFFLLTDEEVLISN